MSFGFWKPYVTAAERRAKAARQAAKLAKSSGGAQPVRIEGRAIASSFWGRGWCTHLESFSDIASRLPRGRSYVRSGAVCDLKINASRVDARVVGSSLYRVEIDIAPVEPATWEMLKRRCAGEIESLVALLQGRLSEPVMRAVANREHGLFPKPGEMSFQCSCPDWADMCKHVAATLYGVGNRLDHEPELLFRLRGVDAAELIDAGFSTPAAGGARDDATLADEQLAGIFGVELDLAPAAPAKRPAPAPPAARTPAAAKPRQAAPASAITGHAVAALRDALGLSTHAFARELRVSQASIKRWESLGPAPINAQRASLQALQRLQQQVAAKKKSAETPEQAHQPVAPPSHSSAKSEYLQLAQEIRRLEAELGKLKRGKKP